MISTAKAIKKTREAQGMTQKELAERCGYTVTDIKAYELGEKEPNKFICISWCVFAFFGAIFCTWCPIKSLSTYNTFSKSHK